MKHLFLGISAFFFIWLITLPLYAQDTTITIYGKKFAPDVIVKINGKPVDSTNIKRDSAQPSRILFVKFPLSWLNKPGASTVIAKGAEASLTSDEVGNIVSVENPGTAPTLYTIYTKPPQPSIAIVNVDSTKPLERQRSFVALNQTNTIPLQIQYRNLPKQNLLVMRLSFDAPLSNSALFQIYDSTMKTILTGAPDIFLDMAKPSNRLSFNVQFKSPSTLPTDTMTRSIRLRVQILDGSNLQTVIQQTIRLELVPIRIFSIRTIAKNDVEEFYQENSNLTNLTRFSGISNFFNSALLLLNSRLARAQDSIIALNNVASKFAQSRFVIKQTTEVSTTNLPLQTSANGNIHKQIDDVQNFYQQFVTLGQNEAFLIISNAAGRYSFSPYQAIASSCDTDRLPSYMVVEAKYAREYINPGTNSIHPNFWEDLRLLLNAIP
ncbi:MAG: hypothetical protein H9535_08745 [Ignavibacteria bacterium]|nr:hypothetical protein [Ignavibacteria bacterium]